MIRRAGRRGDSGSGTVLIVGVIGVLMIIGAVLGILGGALHSRGRAAAAADLAALAAAQVEIDDGFPAEAGDCSGQSQRAAAAVAEANGVTLARCVLLADGSVLVTTELALTGPLKGLGPASADARAGRAAVGH